MMHVDLLMEALPIMGVGYLGIFIVTGVIIGVVALLNYATSDKAQRWLSYANPLKIFTYLKKK